MPYIGTLSLDYGQIACRPSLVLLYRRMLLWYCLPLQCEVHARSLYRVPEGAGNSARPRAMFPPASDNHACTGARMLTRVTLQDLACAHRPSLAARPGQMPETSFSSWRPDAVRTTTLRISFCSCWAVYDLFEAITDIA